MFAGDLGPKLGDPANDTGFMRLDNVRVPRDHMLSKYQQVSPDGKYHKSKKATNSKLHYATMMFTRGNMVRCILLLYPHGSCCSMGGGGGGSIVAVAFRVREMLVRLFFIGDGFTSTPPRSCFL